MIGKKRYKVKLNDHERKELEEFVSRGKKGAREINRARILLLSDEGKKGKEISELLGISLPPIYSM